MEIDGDEFAEADYGLVVDNSASTQQLQSKLDTLAQAALQNQLLSFSTIMKLFSSTSIAEKQRLVERDERDIQERQQQAQQQQLESQQNIAQMQIEQKQEEIDQKERANVRDNETKILIAQIGKYAGEETSEDIEFSPEAKANLQEKIREFDLKLKLDRDKLKLEESKVKDETRLKEKQINKSNNKKQV